MKKYAFIKNVKNGKKYSFPTNTITHIHGISPDNVRNGVIVLTGDLDNGSGI